MGRNKIAFVGLGVMGSGMAHNMQKKNGNLMVFDANKEKLAEFAQGGFAIAQDNAEVAQNDIIFLSLPNTAVVESVLLGENGLLPYLKEGTIVVDLSTISYEGTLRLQKVLEQNKIYFMDAPVSGMKARAEDGTLTVMCGGKQDIFDKVKPYLDMIGTKVLYMGKIGCGQLTKLINQVLFDINAAALAEILPMAIKMGLDGEKIGEVVNSGTGRSYASEFFIQRVLNGVFTDGYLLNNAYKDLISAAELSANNIVPMPVLAAATTTFQMAMCEGYGACDKGGMIQVYENLLGVEFRKAE